MELNEYQEKAMTTCLPSADNLAYMVCNLLGEVGELIEKINDRLLDKEMNETAEELRMYSFLAKKLRKEPDTLPCIQLREAFAKVTDEVAADEDIKKEVGDIMWQTAGVCKVLGWQLSDVCQQNLDKLASRQQRKQIDGDGDNR